MTNHDNLAEMMQLHLLKELPYNWAQLSLNKLLAAIPDTPEEDFDPFNTYEPFQLKGPGVVSRDGVFEFKPGYNRRKGVMVFMLNWDRVTGHDGSRCRCVMETALLAPTFLAPETIRKLRLTLVGNFTPMIYSTFLMKSVDAMMHEDPELIDQFSRQHEWDNHDDDEWDDKDSTATQLSLEQQRMQKIIGEYGIFNLDTPKGLKKDPLKDDGILDTDAVRNLLKDLG
jgi:hypothetical protein